MPTYEYECTKCGYKFDKFQNITDKPLSICPKCHKKLRRLIGAGAGIIFKKSKPETAKGETPNICPKAKEGCDACQRDK